MKRRRSLSDEERALWSGVARSITPMHRRHAAEAREPGDDTGTSPHPPRSAVRAEAPPAPAVPPLAPLERRFKQRLARGREPIDARLDLHGFTQAEAHAALLRFLRGAQGDGARIALVVTGKGTGKTAEAKARDGAAERGVLRRQVPLWLSLPEFRPFVVGFEDAHVAHGGQGALYVRLRRRR